MCQEKGPLGTVSTSSGPVAYYVTGISWLASQRKWRFYVTGARDQMLNVSNRSTTPIPMETKKWRV